MEIGMPAISKITVITIVVLGGAVLAFKIGVQQTEFKEWHRLVISESRFAQIQLALMNYHYDHGNFPPTKYQPKANGPIHSWRVLLARYADIYTEKLYSKYNFSEDWNSPGNLAIAREILSQTQLFSMNDDDVANYLAIGDEENWPSKKPLKSFLVTKGKDKFLIVEDPDSKILWNEPKY